MATRQTPATPAYGRRLLPNILDDDAVANPTRVYAAIPKTSDVKDGYLQVTIADLARCVDFMAKWIEDKFGKSSNFETITYIGLSELRGPATFLAAVKAGYKLLIPSPRNTPQINSSLMNSTQSTKVLYAAEVAPLVKALYGVRPEGSFVSEALPSLQEMLDSTPEHYPYNKTFDEARDDPVVVLHSSGSTGDPKPIICTNGSWAAVDNDHNIEAPPGRQKRDTTFLSGKGPMYLVLPFFHLGGFWFFIHHAICNNLTLVLGPPQQAPDAALLKEIAQHQELRGIMVVPAILQQILHDPDGMDFLRRLNFAAVAGAPAAPEVGNQVSSAVELFNWIGSTETFPLPELYKSREDWLYHEFPPSMKHEMELHDPKEGTYELVIIADESTKDSCPTYHNVPGVPEYHTKDLFQKHPEKPNLYKYYGRKDDIIVLANGEKINPIPLEQHVQGHPSIHSAVLVGEGRNQTAIMLEPTPARESKAERADFLASIWELVQQSNKHVPGPGRVSRDKLICALPDKPFPRTAKNTVIRKRAERAYREDINSVYTTAADLESQLAAVDLEPTTKTVYEPSKIISFLRQVFAPTFPAAQEIGRDEDFFAYGLDSIQILEVAGNLRRNLQRQTSSSTQWITPRTILSNASFADLSVLLAAFLNENIIPQEDTQLDRARALDEAVSRHTAGLPERPSTVAVSAPITTSSTTVAFLGSTGYLGTHTLASLIQDASIAEVYCLNRSKNAQEKQEAALLELDGSLQSFWGKLKYVQVEIGKPYLGLSRDQYDLLVEKVDVIVYNSWRLDFSLSLRSFDPFLQAIREALNLSISSKRNVQIVFISSLSSVGALETIPEAPVEDASAALSTGYAQSKLAAERILTRVSQQSGVPTTIVRIGQIGGPSLGAGGIWADQQWISGIIHTSKALGCLPGSVMPIDWVPVDKAAAMLHAFVLEPPQEGTKVYNICSDKPQSWELFTSTLQELLGIPQVVSLPEWIRKVRGIENPTPEDAARLPALKMLDWYEALGDGKTSSPVATSHAKAVSNVEMPSVDRDLLVSWLRGWGL